MFIVNKTLKTKKMKREVKTNILIALFMFIIVPTLLLILSYVLIIGIVIQALITFICYIFMTGKVAFLLGWFIYWLICFCVIMFFYFGGGVSNYEYYKKEDCIE